MSKLLTEQDIRERIQQIQFDCWSDSGKHSPEISSCQECSNQLMQLITQYGNQRELEGRIDETGRIPEHWETIFDSTTREHFKKIPEDYKEKRLVELKQQIMTTLPTPHSNPYKVPAEDTLETAADYRVPLTLDEVLTTDDLVLVAVPVVVANNFSAQYFTKEQLQCLFAAERKDEVIRQLNNEKKGKL